MVGTNQDRFLALSRILTGVDRLSEDLSDQYLKRISASFDDKLTDLLDVFGNLAGDEEEIANGVREKIMPDSEIGIVAREIIMLWYMSGYREPDGADDHEELGPETPEQYFQGLLWPAIRAHPLGLSGGYFGYWHYPPET